jgi:hypothetical protein
MGWFNDFLFGNEDRERNERELRRKEEERRIKEEEMTRREYFRNLEFPPEEENITWKWIDYHGDHQVHISQPIKKGN